MKMNNGVTAWAISPSKYVNEAVKILRNGYKRTSQKTGMATGPPTHFQQIMTVIWTEQMNLMKTKQQIISSKLEFCTGLLN